MIAFIEKLNNSGRTVKKCMEFACNEDKGSWKEINVGRRLSKSLLSKTVE